MTAAGRWLLQGIAVFGLAGCVVGPDYVPPAEEVVPQYVHASDTTLSSTAIETEWWKTFDDPLLVDLIELALQQNRDLQVASQNLLIARARLGDTEWQRYPGTELGGEASRTKTSQEVSSVNRPRENRYTSNLNISWEIDVFGRVRRLVESGQAEAEASAEDLRDVQVMVVADVADQYLSLRAAQQRLRVAQENADVQQQTLELAQALVEGGVGNAVDTELARAQQATTLATIPVLQADIQQSIHRLSVLSGQRPGFLQEKLAPVQPLPSAPQTFSIGTPYRLLQRRPDVRAAERRLAAQTALVGVAVADLYPRFDLTGLLGLAARDIGSLTASSAETWRIGLGVTWPAFDLPRARIAVDIAEAETQAQLARYQQSVLLALEEVETALVRYLRNRERLGYLQTAAEASQQAAGLSRDRFQAGASGFLTVLEAETRRLEAEDRLALGQAEMGLSVITLFRALGGTPAATTQGDTG